MTKKFDLNFDIRQVRSFVETVREASLTRASRKLGIGQATISHHLLQLEEALGATLIVRSSRSFSLTGDGEKFLAYCEEILSGLERLRSGLGFGGGDSTATIAASTIPASYILPAAVASVRSVFPGFIFRTVTSNSREAIELVKEGKADAAIAGRVARHPSLVYRRCASDSIVLIGNGSMPDSLSPRQLEDTPLVVRESGSGTRAAYEKKLAEKGISPSSLRVALECSTSEGVREAVASGVGAGFISSLAVKRELETGTIKVIRLPGTPIVRDFYAVHREGRALVPAAEELIKQLLSAAGKKKSAPFSPDV